MHEVHFKNPLSRIYFIEPFSKENALLYILLAKIPCIP